KEPEKGHKLVDAAMRCVLIPDDPADPTISQDCVGNYEYMPDESWKGTGTCTDNYPDGKISLTWQEGSDLKEYTYTKTGGTGWGSFFFYLTLVRAPWLMDHVLVFALYIPLAQIITFSILSGLLNYTFMPINMWN